MYRDFGSRAIGFPAMPLYNDDESIGDELVDHLEEALRKSVSEGDVEPMETSIVVDRVLWQEGGSFAAIDAKTRAREGAEVG